MGKQVDENDEFDFEESTLKIGQVIYVLSQKETKIIPAQICEMINVQNLQGTSTIWKVAFGPKENRKVVELNKIPGRKALSLEGALAFIRHEFDQFLSLEKRSVEKKVEGWFDQVAKPDIPKPKQEADLDEEEFFNEISKTVNETPTKAPPSKKKQQQQTETPYLDENKVMLDDGIVGNIVMTDEMKELIQ